MLKRINNLKCPTEANEATALAEWAAHHHIAKNMFHIPNGGSRHIIEAKNLKKQGVKEGIPDYFLPYPCNGKAGMFIELKRRVKSQSRLTQAQAQCLAHLERVGYHTVIAYGWEDAVQKIVNYLK
jgi:hypothetical protein